MHRRRINPARRCLAAVALLCTAMAQCSFASAPAARAITPQQADLIWRKATEGYAPARAALVAKVEEGAALGPFRPDWASLRNYREPAWFDNAKFGIFVHWGVYAVPAFANEWYPRNMYDRTSAEYAHQVATYGSLAHAGLMDWPESGLAAIKSIAPSDRVRSVRLLGSSRPVSWRQTSEGLAIGPLRRPDGMAVHVYEIDLASAPDATTVRR